MKEIELSVVMPAYREANALRQLLPTLAQSLSILSTRYEIIVADSLEPLDDTAVVCAQYGTRHIHRTGGNAYGDAVRTGVSTSSGEYVLLMDADGSHNPKDIERLWAARHGHDVVIGSRYVAGGSTENPAVLIWMSRVINTIYKIAFDLRINDVSNSFRLYRGEQLRSIYLESTDFEIVEEILIRLAFGTTKATVIEVPVRFEQRKTGESKRSLPAFMLSYLGSILRMRKFRAAELQKESRRR